MGGSPTHESGRVQGGNGLNRCGRMWRRCVGVSMSVGGVLDVTIGWMVMWDRRMKEERPCWIGWGWAALGGLGGLGVARAAN